MAEKRRTGFALLTPEERAEVSRRGGIAAHQYGAGHTFTPEEARIAGAKGGRVAHQNRRERQRKEALQATMTEIKNEREEP
jgi:hypothetical protein